MTDACQTIEPYRLFLSHGGADTYIVEHLLKRKVEGAGASVFLDKGKIEYGDDFRARILSELDICDELLVLFTPSSLSRPWVMAEVGAMLMRGRRIVAITYGVTEVDLQSSGVLSLLGPNSILTMDEFDDYIEQLQCRVEAHNNG